MKFTIGKKLFLGFGAVLALIVGYGAIMVITLSGLSASFITMSARNADEARIILASRLGPVVYRTIADAIINRGDLAQMKKAWAEVKNSAGAELAAARAIVDTAEEKADIAEAEASFGAVVTLFEGGTIPQLELGAAASASILSQVDAEIDVPMKAISASLQKISDSLSAEQDVAEAGFKKTLGAMEELSVIVALVLLALGAAIGIVLARSITGPLRSSVQLAGAVAEGDLTRTLSGKILQRSDETAQLALALDTMVSRMKAAVVSIKTIAGDVSSGSSSLSDAVQQMSKGVQDLSNSAQALSQGATEQASSGEEVSSSMEEMGANIRQNAEAANQTELIADKSAKDAKQGGEAVAQTVEAMRLICSKINVIEEISRQTNLLALNAAIEAARAGEAVDYFHVDAEDGRGGGKARSPRPEANRAADRPPAAASREAKQPRAAARSQGIPRERAIAVPAAERERTDQDFEEF